MDEAALVAARHADRLLVAARSLDGAGSPGGGRWASFLEPIPDRLRDAPLRELRSVAIHARAAFGPKDSIRDALPSELTEPFRVAVDRLLKALARDEMAR